ncbi:glycosyltransferase [Cupriavidus sp. CuC1]|uniref:glycosyltransferase n=1 Tax=Cupriavidus sp. CuC1 TaxID=3373131 RepID=UPI0037D0E33D
MRKILHLTEALAGGVLHSIALLANEQVRAGHSVTLLHSLRPDTPDEEILRQLFDPQVRRVIIHMRSEIGPMDLKSLTILLGFFTRGKYDAIHCHSSKAGALGRIAALLTFQIGKTCYSPHGFSFLRRDVSSRKRMAFLWIERLLHSLGGKISACSATERDYAKIYLKKRHTYLLENAIDLDTIPEKTPEQRMGDEAVIIAISGRVTYAKAPWRFAEVARKLSCEGNTRFMWLGDGDATLKKEWIGDSPVEVSGWLNKARLMQALAGSDIFLFTSLWEGLPIALIEAQAIGIPAVVTNIVGNKDIVVHGETGFLADSEEEILIYTKKLAEDAGLRRRMGHAARQHALRRFNKNKLLETSFSIYFGAEKAS